MPSASQLRSKVTFTSTTRTANGSGGFTRGKDSFVRRAHIMPARGGEAVQGGTLASFTPKTIVVRQDSKTRALTSSDGAAVDGVAHDILAINDKEQRGAFFWIDVKEKPAT